MIKVLIIEDDLQLRESIYQLLELQGFTPITAANGLLGIQLAETAQPDLIICDVAMPELDGYGVLTQLQKHPQTATIPFIFLTAKVERSDLRKGMGLGADDYLCKPFQPQELFQAIQTRLDKHAILQQEYQKEQDRPLAEVAQSLERIKVLTRKESGPWLEADKALRVVAIARPAIAH